MGNCLPFKKSKQPKPAQTTNQPAGLTATQQQVERDTKLQAKRDRKLKKHDKKNNQSNKQTIQQPQNQPTNNSSPAYTPAFDGIVNFGDISFEHQTSKLDEWHNPFEHNENPRITERSTNQRTRERGKRAKLPDFLGLTRPHNQSSFQPNNQQSTKYSTRQSIKQSNKQSTNQATNGVDVSQTGHVSRFPHFSFNDPSMIADNDDEDDIAMHTHHQRHANQSVDDREDSKISSTSLDDDISIRYTTPTMASNHVVRPLPSPSSLSVPQPSIGSGIQSREHSIVHSTLQQPSNKRQQSLPSTGHVFFPSLAHSTSFHTNQVMNHLDLDASPLGNYPHSMNNATASSPPSANSPLTSSINQTSYAAAHVRGHNSVSTNHHLYPHSPPVNHSHLTLNTQSSERAAVIFEDNAITIEPSQQQSVLSLIQSQHQAQKSPRHSMKPHNRRSMGAPSAMSISLSLPESREGERESDEEGSITRTSQPYRSQTIKQSNNQSNNQSTAQSPQKHRRVPTNHSALVDMYSADFAASAEPSVNSVNAHARGSEGLSDELGHVRYA